MKYQTILESRKIMSDQEFEKVIKAANLERYGFKLVEARSLDGIREEAYSCEAMKKAVIKELGDWKKEHDQHFKHRRDASYKFREIARHPAEGPIVEMTCPCGKSIIGFKNSLGSDAQAKAAKTAAPSTMKQKRKYRDALD